MPPEHGRCRTREHTEVAIGNRGSPSASLANTSLSRGRLNSLGVRKPWNVAVMRAMWSDKEMSFRGDFYTEQDARIYTLPDEPMQDGCGGRRAAGWRDESRSMVA